MIQNHRQTKQNPIFNIFDGWRTRTHVNTPCGWRKRMADDVCGSGWRVRTHLNTASSSETYSRKYVKLPNVVIHACTNMTEKYSQLTRRCSGNASALGARGPRFNSRLRQGYLCLDFCFVVVVFTFLSINTLFVTKVC